MKEPSNPSTDRTAAERVLAGGGEMGELARSVDWSQTALGPVEGWSQALRSAAAMVLHNPWEMLLWWGPEFVQIYNDAYRPVLGDKHPRAMGQSFRECWKEVFHILGPMAERPYHGGPASTVDDIALQLNRKVEREEAHFRIAYSPVFDETVQPTGIGGVLATITESTERIYGDRQLRTLKELGVRSAADGTTDAKSCESAAAVFTANRWDVPFALFYLVDAEGSHARLVADAGFDGPADAHAAPREVDLSDSDGAHAWPIAAVARERRIITVDGLQHVRAKLPLSPWSEAPRSAIALPLASPDQPTAYGVLICGISPHRLLTADYRTFFELAAAQVVTAIRNARAFEVERKRAEALAELDRAKTHFFSNVSHEFRTPLTLMLGPTEDLLRGVHGELESEQRAQLELIRRNELRLQRLVNALLDFSRIEAGRANATFAPTDLALLTRELASSFRSAIERAGVRYEVDCPALAEPIYVDRHMWEQIVLNLLSNAFKFTFEGSIELSLRAVEGGVELRVKDTGVGVPEAELPRLFERFHRVEGTRSRTHEGSGIGLALVQDLVQQHGGTVRAESKLGAGTTFIVTLRKGTAHLPTDRVGSAEPIRVSQAAVPFLEEALRWLPDSSPPSDSPDPGLSASRARVLVVDDNADMRAYLRRILSAKHLVETAEDGRAALEAARSRRPDVIVTDVMMPVLGGFAFLRELRADAQLAAIPVLMLSARAGEEARVEGLEAGADDYLVKPFSAQELVARVSTLLKNASMNVEHERLWNDVLAVLRQAPVAVSLCSMPECKLSFVNEAHIRMTGRDATGLSIDEMYPQQPDTARHYKELLRRAFESPDVTELSEFQRPMEDGSIRYYSAALRPWFDVTGRKRGVISVASEVTEQVRSREKLRAAHHLTTRSELELKKALELRDEFLTVAAHELRTPLMTLGLEAETLLRAMQRGDAAESSLLRWTAKAEKLRAQANRLHQLVEGMIDAFGLTSEARDLQLEELDLVELAREVVARFREESKEAQAVLQLRADGPIAGLWDRRRLTQVVTQLLANALKFGAKKPIEVSLTSSADRIRIAVADRGIGIATEDHQRIFERFQRAVPADHYGGLGLGLWIVSEIVKAMRGTVRVESSAGEGATFAVELPRSS